VRIGFMGTPDFSVPALQALIEAGHEIVAVYTQPPRPAGRGYKLKNSPVHEAAVSAGIEVRTPKSLRTTESIEAFIALGLDCAVVAAYGLILPEAILRAPRYGCINIHASLLPRWRGAAPIQRAIMAGDSETGIVTMAMDAGLDTGPMLLREVAPITPQTTGGSLHDQLAEIGARIIGPTLTGIEAGSLKPTPQPSLGVTYAHKLTREDCWIDWKRSAVEIERQIRALSPFPKAWTSFGGEEFKVGASQLEARQGNPGELLDDKLLVGTGKGAIRIQALQRPGKAMMDAASFLRGYPMPTGGSFAF
jgi:methionyl-tRNA formyltransferase